MRTVLAVVVICSALAPAVSAEVRVMEAGGLSAENAALVVSQQEGGDLPMVMWAVGSSSKPRSELGSTSSGPIGSNPAPSTSGFDLTVEVAGAGLPLPAGEQPIRFEICVYALDASLGVQYSLLQVVEIDGEDRARLVESGLRYRHRGEVAAGEYELRVLVRERGAGRLALRSAPLLVRSDDPAAGSELPARLLRPKFSSPDRWVLAESGEAEVTGLESPASAAVFPVLRPGGEVSVTLFGSGLSASPQFVLELWNLALDEKFSEAQIATTSLGPADSSRWQGTVAIDALGEGEYRARVIEQTTGQTAELSVVLSHRGGEAVWAELIGAAASPESDTRDAAATEIARRLVVPRKEIDAALIAVLGQLASGSEVEALVALAELEQRALGGSGALLEVLGQTELQAIERVVGREPEAYVPIIGLYAEGYVTARSRMEHLLATHSRRMVQALVEQYAKRGGAERGELSAAFLVELSSRFSRSAWTERQRVLDRALQISPGDRDAQMAKAFGAEGWSEYSDAVDTLERLTKDRPGDAEALLRLAINELRVGRRKRAVSRLEEIAQGSAPDWIRRVAYHEWVRALLTSPESSITRTVLDEGLELFPDDQKLRTLLSFVLDHAGSTNRDSVTAAAANTESIGIGAEAWSVAAGRLAPRVRYGELSLSSLDAVSKRLGEAIVERLPVLAGQLEAKSPQADRSQVARPKGQS